MGADLGPLIFAFYYLPCAVVGAAAGLLTGLWSGPGAGKRLITTIVGAVGGLAGGSLLATMPTSPPGRGNDALVIAGLVLFTALCGWVVSFIAARLLRRS
jgi:uncharacterized membrane protein YeaQ/YmgE (transglycosylase-associated protein family)